MQTILNTSDNPAHDSLVEKKSEFIGDAAHVDTLDEALAFVTSIREQHPKARHVAYAAVCGGADRYYRLRDCRHPIFRRNPVGVGWFGSGVFIRGVIGHESGASGKNHDCAPVSRAS